MPEIGETSFPEFLHTLQDILVELKRIADAIEAANSLEANHPSRI